MVHTTNPTPRFSTGAKRRVRRAHQAVHVCSRVLGLNDYHRAWPEQDLRGLQRQVKISSTSTETKKVGRPLVIVSIKKPSPKRRNGMAYLFCWPAGRTCRRKRSWIRIKISGKSKRYSTTSNILSISDRSDIGWISGFVPTCFYVFWRFRSNACSRLIASEAKRRLNPWKQLPNQNWLNTRLNFPSGKKEHK